MSAAATDDEKSACAFAKILLSHSARTDLRNKKGLTALQITER